MRQFHKALTMGCGGSCPKPTPDNRHEDEELVDSAGVSTIEPDPPLR
jgi:hypothetical protein